MVRFGKHVLIIKLSFYNGSIPNMAHRFYHRKAFVDVVAIETMTTDYNQFYSFDLSTIETKTGMWTLVGRKIITKTQFPSRFG